MSNIHEIWKPVAGFEGFYEASNLGRIRSLDRIVNTRGGGKAVKKGKVLCFGTTPNGYYVVALQKQRKVTHRTVHRVVAEAFLPNPKEAPTINHINANKHDNSVGNLEWCTAQENTAHAANLKLGCWKGKPITQYSREGVSLKTWGRAIDAAKELGINYSSIGNCACGRRPTAGGFVWQFAPGEI